MERKMKEVEVKVSGNIVEITGLNGDELTEEMVRQAMMVRFQNTYEYQCVIVTDGITGYLVDPPCNIRKMTIEEEWNAGMDVD